MNRKAKGNRNEYKTIRLLESQGYECFRMAGSLGAFDVIGISESNVQLVQVKSNRKPSKAEMETIRNMLTPNNCRKVIHVWLDRQAMPNIEII